MSEKLTADRTIHLATGIVCGGPETWCGAELEIEHDSERNKNVVKNATREKATTTCHECLDVHTAAIKKWEREHGGNRGR